VGLGRRGLQSRTPELRIYSLRISESELLGNSPRVLGIPDLKFENMLESDPPKSRFFLRGLAVLAPPRLGASPAISASPELHCDVHVRMSVPEPE